MPKLIGIGCIYLEPHLSVTSPPTKDCVDYTMTEDGKVIGLSKIATGQPELRVVPYVYVSNA